MRRPPAWTKDMEAPTDHGHEAQPGDPAPGALTPFIQGFGLPSRPFVLCSGRSSSGRPLPSGAPRQVPPRQVRGVGSGPGSTISPEYGSMNTMWSITRFTPGVFSGR